MDHPIPTSRLVNASHCAHLRHKGMYAEAGADPEHARFFDPYDATAYWCTCTQKPLGPDGAPAHADACKPGRQCCA